MDQAGEGFEHGFDSILTDFIKTPELVASFEEADTMLSSVSTGLYVQVVLFMIFINHNLVLESNVINYGARLRHCFCLYHRQA